MEPCAELTRVRHQDQRNHKGYQKRRGTKSGWVGPYISYILTKRAQTILLFPFYFPPMSSPFLLSGYRGRDGAEKAPRLLRFSTLARIATPPPAHRPHPLHTPCGVEEVSCHACQVLRPWRRKRSHPVRTPLVSRSTPATFLDPGADSDPTPCAPPLVLRQCHACHALRPGRG